MIEQLSIHLDFSPHEFDSGHSIDTYLGMEATKRSVPDLFDALKRKAGSAGFRPLTPLKVSTVVHSQTIRGVSTIIEMNTQLREVFVIIKKKERIVCQFIAVTDLCPSCA